jgi:SAM-dependent methyltransferase
MAAIENIKVYNNAMRKSMFDKLFFLADTEDCHSYLDYGCADGTMLKMLSETIPEAKLFGFDINAKQVGLATKKVPQANISISWDSLHISMEPRETAVICSSLIHEVYAYGNQESIDTFWWDILRNEFQYVVIRDMSVSENAVRQTDSVTYAKVVGNSDYSKLKEFESVYGSISDNKNLIHWLLKYRYTDNWNRELHENYLCLSHEKLLTILAHYNYEIISYEHYVLPFLRKEVKNTFKIDLQDNTHIKIILQRK